ncbi:hypothetical protein Tco_1258035, partial [Tanacetum coccineum]
MASSSNRRGKVNTTRPWTTAEEITLCTTWCNAMETYGSGDITKKRFWSVVFDNFEKDMGGTIREYDAIVSKWKNSIRPKVVAFSVAYDGVQWMDENGSSDLTTKPTSASTDGMVARERRRQVVATSDSARLLVATSDALK